MKISLIVAVGLNNQIGINGKLPWYSREDLEYFKEKTMNHTLVMGRKTFEGLPKKLDGRTIIVLSKTRSEIKEVTLVDSATKAINMAKKHGELELFICGGGEIYSQFLELSETIYLTKINYDGNADTYFPQIDTGKWKISEEKKFSDGEWITYEKISDG